MKNREAETEEPMPGWARAPLVPNSKRPVPAGAVLGKRREAGIWSKGAFAGSTPAARVPGCPACDWASEATSAPRQGTWTLSEAPDGSGSLAGVRQTQGVQA